LDNVFTKPELECLQQVFLDPSALYWTSQDYHVEPPSPYVSYLIPLLEEAARNIPGDCGAIHTESFLRQYGALGSVILRVLDKIQGWRPAVVQQATVCEMWAHNRPNPTGHQLHFDSDNEGLGSIRHPMATAILCLSHDDPAHAGANAAPTLLTNQRLVSRYPSDKGWLAFPRVNRLILMDGRVLHCVVPGKRLAPPLRETQSRRVTLMLAFWKRIRVRDEPTPGAARPFPLGASHEWCSWSEALTQPLPRTVRVDDATECSEVQPVTVSHVYENVLTGQPWDRSMGMPSYDEVFQGI
jgi:methyl-CpG-binding domain protein 4